MSNTFSYIDEDTGETVTIDKYFYTQPERNFSAEKRLSDLLTIYNSFVSDPDHVGDTYQFFLSKKIPVDEFIREYNLLKMSKRSFTNIRNEYNDAKELLLKTDMDKLKSLLKKEKKDKDTLSNKDRKIVNGYYRSIFIVKRLEYYDGIIMEGLIGLNGN